MRTGLKTSPWYRKRIAIGFPKKHYRAPKKIPKEKPSDLEVLVEEKAKKTKYNYPFKDGIQKSDLPGATADEIAIIRLLNQKPILGWAVGMPYYIIKNIFYCFVYPEKLDGDYRD